VLRQSLAELTRIASRAPSPANSQPWRFRLRGGGLELLLDRTRLIGDGPSAERQARLACGAALLNLRLAIGQLGYQPLVTTIPFGDEPDLLARVGLGARCSPPSEEERLFAGIVYRHTQRDDFDPDPMPVAMLAALVDAASAEGATLLVADAALQATLDRAMKIVESRDHDDDARDGMRAPWLRGSAGRGATGVATAVLTTAADDPRDHLIAGQALERVLLTAAPHWIFARLASRPLESADTRAMIREAIGAGLPQMLLQLGRAYIAPVTARRPPIVDVVG
jgi:hypothetical protein